MPKKQVSPIPEAKHVQRRLMSSHREQRAHGTAAKHETVTRPAVKRNFSMTLRTWHQRAGLAAFIFMAWLGISGILLNETSDLGLNGINISWPWLMDLYGLHSAPPRDGFSSGGHWLAVTQNTVVLDGHPLKDPVKSPLGMASSNTASTPTLFVATPDSLILLSPTGARVDELRAPLIPVSAIRRIGTVKGHDTEIALQDLDAYESADQGLSWKAVSPTDVNWSSRTPLSTQQRNALVPYSRPSVAVQQFLVDAHSGRLFGRYGTYVIDLIGLLSLVLSSSGVWMWWRTNRRRQQNRTSVSKTRTVPTKIQNSDSGA